MTAQQGSQAAKAAVERFLHKGILLSRDVVDNLPELEDIEQFIGERSLSQLMFINSDVIALLKKRVFDINWQELEQARSAAEKDHNEQLYRRFLECAQSTGTGKECADKAALHDDVKILSDYDKPVSSKEVKDFVGYYNARYKAAEALLRNRQELTNLTSVVRVLNKRDRETVSIIGIVAEKTVTSNNNIILTLEDRSGSIKVLISKKK